MCLCVYIYMWILLHFPQTTAPTHSFSSLHFNLLAHVPASVDLEDIKAKPVDEVVVTRFASGMAKQWEKIGIELKQAHLVRNLRQPNCDVESNCIQVIQAAILSEDLPNYGVLFNALGRYGLSQVATDLLKAAVEHEWEKEQRQCKRITK